MKIKKNTLANIQRLSIKIKHDVSISTQEDIDCLKSSKKKVKLIDKIKMIYRNCSKWKIIIFNNKIFYELSLKGIEKIEYADLDIDYILDDGFSQEEINELLTSIDETENLPKN